MRERKVKVIEWPDAPEAPDWQYSVTCEKCEADLLLPTRPGTRIVASTGMGLVFDNVPRLANDIPSRMRCPVCRTIYTSASVWEREGVQ